MLNKDLKSLILDYYSDGNTYKREDAIRYIECTHYHNTEGQYARAFDDLSKGNKIMRLGKGLYKSVKGCHLTYPVKQILDNSIKEIDKFTKVIDVLSLTPADLNDINDIKLIREELFRLQDNL